MARGEDPRGGPRARCDVLVLATADNGAGLPGALAAPGADEVLVLDFDDHVAGGQEPAGIFSDP